MRKRLSLRGRVRRADHAFENGDRAATQTSLGRTGLRGLVTETLPYPGRFRAAARSIALARSLRALLPGELGAMLGMPPEHLPKAQLLPNYVPAVGTRRARVALLAGCAQRVLDPEINWATLRVPAHNGVKVIVSEAQGCCGALSAHTGVKGQAQRFAKHNLAAFPEDVDAVLTNAAGCGSGLHEYLLWLRGKPEEAAAHAFAAKARDISAFLFELGALSPPPLATPLRVAYHDACHLAQGVRREPRALLGQILSIELLEPDEADLCCGSAGTYNLEHPEMAGALGARKAQRLLETGAELIVSGNIGCLTQLRLHLRALRRPLPLLHTVQLLDRAYAAE